MVRYKLKRDADPKQLRRCVQLVLNALAGKDYRKMTRAEATLINNTDLIEEEEEQE